MEKILLLLFIFLGNGIEIDEKQKYNKEENELGAHSSFFVLTSSRQSDRQTIIISQFLRISKE